jgi:crotonobetaine/carnitine-CoA ligase
VIDIDETSTIGDAFARAVQAYASRPFLAVPAGAHRSYHRDGYEIEYATAGREVEKLCDAYRTLGYGHGHRIAMLLDNRPEHLLHKLAFNTLGISCVPVNPDYRANEIAYLLDSSAADLAIVSGERREQLMAGLASATHMAPVALFDELATVLPASRPRRNDPVSASSEASILYTSGTTGRPKGCILSHGYELASGRWYATRGHLAAFRPEGERLYNPLPVYHVNSSVLSFHGIIQTGSCQIQPDRFHPNRWWQEIHQTRATIVHYLGVIVPLLLGMAPCPEDREHLVRFGIGAGVEPQLHAAFEARFGFPLIEVWGMTEMVRVLLDHELPRSVGTRCCGRPAPGVEVRIVDEMDQDVPVDSPGEMVVRHSAATPRRDFFSGYLNDDEATAEAWRNGWFHTGDSVRQDSDGTLHFVDRKKNIIRRSGENIAAAEVEATLQVHPMVQQVAVIAAPDEVREEEVYACVVLNKPTADPQAAADLLFEHCYAELAYFKAPGWIHFLSVLPTTGTQKIQKYHIFPGGTDPRAVPGVFDMRQRKRRIPKTTGG